MDLNSELLNEEDRIVSELTEKDKRTVEKFNRQLSSHSILSIRSEEVLDDRETDKEREEITEEEALRLQRVIQAFQNAKDIYNVDEIDGRKYKRLSSNQSFEFLLSAPKSPTSDSRFVSPGRFYVSLTEETKAIVKEVNELIQKKKNTIRRTQSTEILVVENYELSSSYANDKNHSSVANSNHVSQTGPRFLSPEDIRIGLNNPSRHNQDKFYFPEANGTGTDHAMYYTENNGHAYRHATWGTLSLYSPKEKFRLAVQKVIQLKRKQKEEERDKKRKDYMNKLWKRRGDVGWFGLLFTLAGPCAFIADSITDIKVASDHFSTNHPWWGTFTLILVIFPTIIMNIVSYFFYKDDEEQANRKPESGWRTVKITHCFQLGLIERYWRIFVKGCKIKFKQPDDIRQYQMYIAMNLDTAMLQMILAFTEDAPQLVLQLYILIRRKLVEKLLSTSLQDMWTLASICFSFISYSRALVNYNSCLRDSKKEKGQLRWYGYIAMWFWRAFMFISRVLVLVFFATEFHLWFFLVLFLHFVIILFMMLPHKVNFFAKQKVLQWFIRVVFSYIHTFCYFVLEARKTITWALKYYLLIALEAIVFSTLWFTNNTRYVSLKFELAGMSIIFLSFVFGLLMMVAYYKFLHPKFKRPQTKWYTKSIPKEELCEDVKNEDEEEEEENQGDVEQGIHDPINRAASMIKQVGVWV